MLSENLGILERTYTAEDFGSPVLVKLADDDSHVVVLQKRKRNTKTETQQTQSPKNDGKIFLPDLFWFI